MPNGASYIMLQNITLSSGEWLCLHGSKKAPRYPEKQLIVLIILVFLWYVMRTLNEFRLALIKG